jgi:glycosyltransferase involved in cell wall biosynthesis
LFYLLAPKTTNLITGGFLYNDRISRHLFHLLGKESFAYLLMPLQELMARISELNSSENALILDSLLIQHAEDLNRLLARRAAAVILLAHYLPSLDPLLSAKSRQNLTKMERMLFQVTDGACVPSRYLKDEIVRRGLARETIIVCPPGIDQRLLTHRTRETGGNVQILTVANWTRSKGHLFLLEVLADLAHLSWSWHIVGDTEIDPELVKAFQAKVAQTKLKSRIHVHGALPPEETQEFFREADLFILASLTESYGMVFAESLAAGLPSIGNNVGGVPEIIAHEQTGFLCEPKNRSEWRSRLESIISSPDLRERMRAAALKHRKGLASWEMTAEKLIGLLNGILVNLKRRNYEHDPPNHKNTS